MLFAVGCQQQKKEKAVNVMIIFPDQFRQFSLGFWSEADHAKHIHGAPDPVSTPALNTLAKEGIVFSRAMSNFPLCSPFRGMLLTGMYPYKNGLTANCRQNRDVGIVKDGNSIANIFADAGYETAYFGKCHWHKTEPVFDEAGNYKGTTDPPGGFYVNSYDTYVPPGAPRLGFRYFFQVLRDTHSDPLCYSNDPMVINGLKDGELYKPGRFNAALEAEVIIKYLENSHGQRDKDKPFFITWSLNPPHNPWVEEHTDMRFYPQYTDNGQVNIDRLLVRENADTTVGTYAPYYFANVSAVDHYIGLVLDKLEDIGAAEHTIIVFTSDHGEMLGSHGLRAKPYPENEAFNIPFIVKWGNKLRHRVEDLKLSVPDVMPTLLGLAGLEEKIPNTVQGRNFAGLLKDPGADSASRPNAVLYMDYMRRGLYTGDYTFVVRASENEVLEEAYYYDNKKDPYQLDKILLGEMDARLEHELKTELVRQLQAIDDQWAAQKICGDYLDYGS
jgi:arylsulfatase A-like enzyme